MKAYEDVESKVTVEFTKTLVGHGIDLGRMKITREEKEDISNECFRDRVFDQLISVEVSSKISQLRKRHKVGQSLTSLCVQNNEEWSVSSTRDEEMIICEDRKILEKEAHVDNLRATSNTDRNFQGRIPERMHATNT
ncbi:hypothetical protein TNCV_3755371 [Trichonephila clavipes]|nr:hypothetical protein TNCV_3755371 [Trichonephila clavipes]